jgi:hypothetical protein
MTALDSDMQSRAPRTVFATLAIACFVYSASVLALMHVLRPDLAPASHFVSEYALGRYGWMMGSSFLAMGFGCLMLLLGLVRIGIRSWVVWLGAGLLGVEFLGSLVAAIFPMDLPTAQSTLAGRIHDMNFLVGIGSFSLALLLLTAGFWSDPRWRAYRLTALTLVLLYVVAVILQFVTARPGMPYGLVNRFVFATFIAWPLGAAIQLWRISRNSFVPSGSGA